MRPSKIHHFGFTLAASMLILAFLFGCTVGPDFETPVTSLEPSWYQEERDGLTSGATELVTWWEVFNDPKLNRLVEEAHRANNNLEIAAVRILETRASPSLFTKIKGSHTLFPHSQPFFTQVSIRRDDR